MEWKQLKWTDHYGDDLLQWKTTKDGGGFRCTIENPPLWLLGDPLVCLVKLNKKVPFNGILRCQIATSDDRELIVQRDVFMQ